MSESRTVTAHGIFNINTIADAFHYKKSEIAIVDDYWYQLDRAADGGFQAYFPIQIINYMNQSM